jgi:DNA-binding NarL/FixJ family response regulator
MENKIVIADASTGEVIERSFTEDELQEFQSSQSEIAAVETAKSEARTSALAKLAALGLTEEEIAAL